MRKKKPEIKETIRCLIDNGNLEFLQNCAKSGRINEFVSVARIVWSSLPELRLNADSKIIIDGVSATCLDHCNCR